ncbi:hypothetical protein, partial [Phaeobacter sp. 22II1-1F12B]|uniref:hypothetical protein n=1 Tax=Phaeobacter sp. 22II1-1F12B TaxID=1317111 RepID=UPI000B6C70AE
MNLPRLAKAPVSLVDFGIHRSFRGARTPAATCASLPFVQDAANGRYPPIPWKNTRSLAQNIDG